MDLSKWKTPNTCDEDYGALPKGSGIYLFVWVRWIGTEIKHDILYVGQSTNIAQRMIRHDIKELCEQQYDYVRVYFRRCPQNKLRTRERNLIRRLNPPFNLQHRVRGIVNGQAQRTV